MLSIIQKALCDSDDYFVMNTSTPLNPYTKHPFGTHDMYQFYFFLRYQTNFSIPSIFDAWHSVGFCIEKLQAQYESLIKKHSIRDYILNADVHDKSLQQDIFNMLREDTYCRKHLRIDPKFQPSDLVRTFRSYGYLYYLLNYGDLDESTYLYCDSLLKNALYQFVKKYPNYGKKIKTKSKPKQTIEKDVPEEKECASSFMESLSFKMPVEYPFSPNAQPKYSNKPVFDLPEENFSCWRL